MAQKTPYLYRTKYGVYYFRLRVPNDLQHLTTLRDIRRSLTTSHYRVATRMAASLMIRSQLMFEEARRSRSLDLGILSSVEVLANHSVVSDKAPLPPSSPSVPLLSHVAQELVKTLKKERVSTSVLDIKLFRVGLLIEIVGDLPVDKYTRNMSRKFQDVAMKLPPRTPANAHLSVQALLREPEGKVISIATYNNYIKDISSVFNYALREGYCKANPFAGLKIKPSYKPSLERQRYTQADIQTLFSSALFKSGGAGVQPHKYWLPLLALYTGGRMNELCQLRVDDVHLTRGVWCIDIDDKHQHQKLKTVESRRIIPLHPKLLGLGIIDYVNGLKSSEHQQLFPELRYHPIKGYSSGPSKWFARYKAEHLYIDPHEKKDFHSFRHTFADSLKQHGVPEAVAASLLGHKLKGITYGRYGKEFPVEKLLVTVRVLDFDLNDVGVYQRCDLN
jgi:integrase